MHVKTVILDHELVLTGSVNLTHNGVQNSKEHLYRVQHPKCVAKTARDFEATWKLGPQVTERVMLIVMANDKDKKARKALEKKARSSLRSRSQSAPRSSKSFENRGRSRAPRSCTDSERPVIEEEESYGSHLI